MSQRESTLEAQIAEHQRQAAEYDARYKALSAEYTDLQEKRRAAPNPRAAARLEAQAAKVHAEAAAALSSREWCLEHIKPLAASLAQARRERQHAREVVAQYASAAEPWEPHRALLERTEHDLAEAQRVIRATAPQLYELVSQIGQVRSGLGALLQRMITAELVAAEVAERYGEPAHAA